LTAKKPGMSSSALVAKPTVAASATAPSATNGKGKLVSRASAPTASSRRELEPVALPARKKPFTIVAGSFACLSVAPCAERVSHDKSSGMRRRGMATDG
jgi:hypothetical protein